MFRLIGSCRGILGKATPAPSSQLVINTSFLFSSLLFSLILFTNLKPSNRDYIEDAMRIRERPCQSLSIPVNPCQSLSIPVNPQLRMPSTLSERTLTKRYTAWLIPKFILDEREIS